MPVKRPSLIAYQPGYARTAPLAVARPAPPVAAPAPAFADRQGEFASWDGPDPNGDFQRFFTAEGGIKLTFKVKDLRAWRWWVRVALWLLAMAGTVWFALRASPYPLVPHGCPLLAPCIFETPGQQVALNLGLLVVVGFVYARILFVEEQALASIEIRPDCMILDGADVFWLRHMQLGWPRFVIGPEDSTILRGVYGARQVDYMTLHKFDDLDCSVQLIEAHFQFAVQQLWAQPGSTS